MNVVCPAGDGIDDRHEETTRGCPVCGDACFTDERYCQACGADVEASRPTRDEIGGWEALVLSDRAFFEMNDAGDLPFPSPPVERVFRLKSGRATIGRSSASSGERPDLDLSFSPTDRGVSHRHAVLALRPDGTWSITDCGSFNGTFINDRTERLAPDDEVALAPGDRIHVGAWTTIVLRATTTAAESPT
jgi:hypothetical protein